MTLKTFTDIVGRRYHLAKKKERNIAQRLLLLVLYLSTLSTHMWF